MINPLFSALCQQVAVDSVHDLALDKLEQLRSLLSGCSWSVTRGHPDSPLNRLQKVNKDGEQKK